MRRRIGWGTRLQCHYGGGPCRLAVCCSGGLRGCLRGGLQAPGRRHILRSQSAWLIARLSDRAVRDVVHAHVRGGVRGEADDVRVLPLAAHRVIYARDGALEAVDLVPGRDPVVERDAARFGVGAVGRRPILERLLPPCCYGHRDNWASLIAKSEHREIDALYVLAGRVEHADRVPIADRLRPAVAIDAQLMAGAWSNAPMPAVATARDIGFIGRTAPSQAGNDRAPLLAHRELAAG